ncbi:MAG: hypothetical protein LQ346_009025 [Caloplaca aetnensis]|nr:MAG: hypothetical protein LQ346_009025 [Caloplaca aetnensis]
MRASEIREPGDAAYGQTMRAAEFMVSPSDEDLRSQATRYGGNGTWAFYAASLEKMLTQLVEATESRLGSSIAAAYIVPPFNPPLVPNPVRWHDLLRHVSASLGRQVPPSGVEATDLAITGLGDPCTPAYSNRKNPLILTIDYSQAALTALLTHADCHHREFFSKNYDLYEPHLGAATLADLPDNFSRAYLTQALGNLISLPWLSGEHVFTQEKIVRGPEKID